MHRAGDKVYDKPGNCPVCGMNLVKVPSLPETKKAVKNHSTNTSGQYTCPMHPEIIRDAPGSCPICGMDLVLMNPSDTEDQKTYTDLVKKMKIAVVFTVPIFVIAMIEMAHNNPFLQLMYHCKIYS